MTPVPSCPDTCAPVGQSRRSTEGAPVLVIVSRLRSVRTLGHPALSEGVAPGLRHRMATRVEHAIGGVQVHFDNVQRTFEGTGHEVVVVTPFDGWWVAPFLAAAIRKVLLRASPSVAERWHRRWHRWAIEHNYRRVLGGLAAARDPFVVYAQCVLSAGVALRHRSGGGRVVMVSHSSGSEADEAARRGECRVADGFHRGMTALERRTLPQLDGLVFPSEAAAIAALRRVPDAGRVPRLTVPNFIADEWADPGLDLPDAAAVRDLVAVGHLVPAKNQGYLLEVIAAAALAGRRYTVTLVGAGPERERLEERARRLGIDAQVDFVGESHDVAAILGRHRAFIHCSLMETFGIVIVEAMAAGLPIFAAPVGGIVEIFDDGVEGRFLPLGSAGEAAGILVATLDDSAELARMASAARSRFADTFCASVVGPRIQRFLHDAMSPAAS